MRLVSLTFRFVNVVHRPLEALLIRVERHCPLGAIARGKSCWRTSPTTIRFLWNLWRVGRLARRMLQRQARDEGQPLMELTDASKTH